MPAPGDPRSHAEPLVSWVRCRRLDGLRPVDRHLRCPYCFGGAREVSAGDAERFCDFRPDVDPLVYGFPVGHDRADEA